MSDTDLTKEQYAVLRAIKDGKPHTLFATMRRRFLRLQWLKPDGDYPAPSPTRRIKHPSRQYAVTPAGDLAIGRYESAHAAPAPEVQGLRFVGPNGRMAGRLS